MVVRRLGTWLAIVAIALQAAWPLLAAAKPRSVALVPLCTVDGVTHYLEVPTGKTPLDSVHHEHCAFCFLGQLSAASSKRPIGLCCDACTERAPAADSPSLAQPSLITQDARAPPLLPVRGI